MCQFHKSVAIQVAADLHSGGVRPVHYALTICALARFWVDKYMPDMGHLNGYSYSEMATDAARQAFASSDLPKNSKDASHLEEDRLAFVRDVVDAYIEQHHLSASELHLPKHPDKNTRFLDLVMMEIYDGPATEARIIKQEPVAVKYESFRQAMNDLFAIEGFGEALEGLLQTSIARLFIAAPEQVNTRWMSVYNRLPMGLRTAFGSCSLHGGGGAAAHIIVCGGLNLSIGGFSGAFMNAAMYAVGPLVATATTYGVEKYRMNDFNAYKYVTPIILSLAAAFGASKLLPHEHSTDPRMQWFYSLSAEGRHTQLQKDYARYTRLPIHLRQQVDEEASRQKMTVAMFMTSLDVCGGSLTPQIQAFEMQNQSFKEMGLK